MIKIGDIYNEKYPYNADKIQYVVLCIEADSIFCRKTQYGAIVKKNVIEKEIVSHCILHRDSIEEVYLIKETK